MFTSFRGEVAEARASRDTRLVIYIGCRNSPQNFMRPSAFGEGGCPLPDNRPDVTPYAGCHNVMPQWCSWKLDLRVGRGRSSFSAGNGPSYDKQSRGYEF